MSYAQSASSGSNHGSQQRGRFFNNKMIVCMSNGVSYEHLAEKSHECGYWLSVSGYQKVDYNCRFALVVESGHVRDLLIESGIDVDGIHITFAYHKKRDTRKRVYVSHFPVGITMLELREIFSFYGEIVEVIPFIKGLCGHRVDTGDRILIFRSIQKDIPSYVFVRGWRGFVKYDGQPQTCRVCEGLSKKQQET